MVTCTQEQGRMHPSLRVHAREDTVSTVNPKWHVGFCNVTTTEYAGIRYSEYYGSPALMLEAQLKAIDYAEHRWGVGRFMKPYIDLPSVCFASFLGMPVVVPDEDEIPYLDTTKPVIADVADVDQVRIGDPKTSGWMAKRWEAWQYYAQQGQNVRFGGYEGSVITTACEVTGGSALWGMSENPEAAKRLLDLMVDANLAIEALDVSLCGESPDGYTGDDYAGLLSPEMFHDLAVPCYQRLYAGKRTRFMHSELLRAEHLRIARDLLDITEFHGAGCKNLTLQEMHEIMGNNFWAQVTPQEMLELSPADISERIRELAQSGAAYVQIYPGRGTPARNMDAAIAAAHMECTGGPAWHDSEQ